MPATALTRPPVRQHDAMAITAETLITVQRQLEQLAAEPDNRKLRTKLADLLCEVTPMAQAAALMLATANK